MSEIEKLTLLGHISGEDNEEILLTYLKTAEEIVLNRLYPFHPENHTVPARYSMVSIDIASYLINKRGAEGESYHSENGINRTYDSAGVPESMLKSITPFVGVI